MQGPKGQVELCRDTFHGSISFLTEKKAKESKGPIDTFFDCKNTWHGSLSKE